MAEANRKKYASEKNLRRKRCYGTPPAPVRVQYEISRSNERKRVCISGTSPDGTLAELIELRDHPYFIGCQYHPEFQSKPNKPHPLFKGFIAAALAIQAGGEKPNNTIERPPISVSDEEVVLQR